MTMLLFAGLLTDMPLHMICGVPTAAKVTVREVWVTGLLMTVLGTEFLP